MQISISRQMLRKGLQRKSFCPCKRLKRKARPLSFLRKGERPKITNKEKYFMTILSVQIKLETSIIIK